MKPTLCLTLLVLMSGYHSVAQRQDPVSALQTVVETERSFARSASERGIQQSFLAFIAEDGLLFRPGAVNGKKWLLEHPEPASEKRPLLSWWPAFADVAQAGDLAYTFGPWELKADVADEKPVRHGHFFTVWKKQIDGSWKFVVDLGIVHPAPKQPRVDWQLPANYKEKSWKGTEKVDLEAVRTILLSRDRQFAGVTAEHGQVKAYTSYSAPELRLFREKSYPFEGLTASASALAAKVSPDDLLTWQPLSADVSRSEDLGYTHGTYTLSSKLQPQKVTERGSYVRVWKKQNKIWKVVLDVTNVWPPTNPAG
jgi:ketosteroid isomerase-like protein